jgi:hypothetical protein
MEVSGTRAVALLLAEDFRATINWQKFYAFIGEAEALDRYDVAGNRRSGRSRTGIHAR